MHFRMFPQHVEEIAKRCYQNPVTDERFWVIGGRLGSMSGAAQVEMKSGLTAFAKPFNVDDRTLLGVASEKIASDLAYLLDLPVSPVQINTAGADAGMNATVVLSYVALPGLATWGVFTPNGSQLDALRPTLSAMWVFHAWINDRDHMWNDNNALLVIDRNDRALKTCFIDYTLSLAVDAPPTGPIPADIWERPQPHQKPYGVVDEAAMSIVVKRIETLEEEALNAIVARVPTNLIDEQTKTRLSDGLRRRRDGIRAMMKLENAK